MKIGIFTNAYKPIISGVVKSIELIKKGLREQGHKIYIFAPRYSGYRDREAGVFRFMSLNLSNRVKFPLAIPYSMRIFNIIERVDLDIIHSHHPFILGEVGAHFAKKLDIPLVYTFHTQFEQYAHYVPLPEDMVKKAARTSVHKYTEKCDMVICPSSTVFSLLNKYEVRAPVELIPNAIDLDDFKDAVPEKVREQYGFEENDKVLIYVGRIGKEKSLPMMLRCFKRAAENAPNARLMIVGEGPELPRLRELKREMGLQDKVTFTGRVEFEDIANYYSAAYSFIMTSTSEVKPLALLEAMASGLPVVAVSAAGSSDTINHEFDGLLTNNDEDEFTGALLRILTDEGLHDRLSEGADQTAQQYSIVNIAKRLEKLYRGLIRDRIKEYAI